MLALSIITASLSGVALLFTLVNLATWPRRASRDPGSAEVRNRRVSILIPARNEAAVLPATLAALKPLLSDVHELIVFSDASTDSTDAIVEEFAADHECVRLVQGSGLPEGWVGKPHACYQLGENATGDLLLFVDADVELQPRALRGIVALMEEHQAGCLSAVPRQVTGTWFERLILPLLHLTYLSWFPLILTRRSPDARFLAANGQVLAVTRETYAAVGGFASVRNEVVEDMAFCRRAKHQGFGVVFVDGHELARCRMYNGAREVWEGFSKNLYEGIGGSVVALLFVVALYTLAFIVPWFAAVPALLSLLTSWVTMNESVALVFVGAMLANIVQRSLMAVRYNQPVPMIPLHPMGIGALLAIAINSFLWSRGDRIVWAGRSYASRKGR